MTSAFKLPESVLVVIHTQDLQVLVMERAGNAGFWQSVTGSKDTLEEAISTTAAREVLEETGLDTTQFRLTDWNLCNIYEIYPVWRHRYAPGVTTNTEHVFGLTVPHIARAIVGPDQRWVLPYSLVLAPTLLLVADVIGRVVTRPGELQVAIVTAVIGAPVFIAIVRRRRIAQL